MKEKKIHTNRQNALFLLLLPNETLPLVFDMGMVYLAGRWIWVSQVWVLIAFLVPMAICIPISIKPVQMMAGLD